MGHRISRPKAALSPAVLLLVATGVSGLATALLAAADDSSTELTPEMPEIVARSIEKHGGEGFRASEVRYQLCSKSGCVDVCVRRNGGLYEHEVEGDFGGEARRIVVGNDSVSLWIDGERREVARRDEQRWRDMVTARMYHVFLPFKLVDPSVRFADLGLEAWGERQLHRVAVGFEAGSSTDHDDSLVFWFDPESARLEQFAYSYEGNPGGLRFRRLHNYRRLGGLLFHDQENLGREGPGLGVHELSAETVGRLRHVSDVEVRGLRVQPIRPAP